MTFFLIALAGFLASLVDGSLGMGFGPTSSTILLSAGLSPKAVSGTVNIVKVASGIAAAISHMKFGNVNRRLTLELALPGMAGAGIGVGVLSNVDGKTLKPLLSAMLIFVGVRILIRFATHRTTSASTEVIASTDRIPARGVTVAAAAGGVTNGLIGAWGPVVTPFLLSKNVPPRYAIGSVNTAEVAVAVVAAGSLISSFGSGDNNLKYLFAMMLGSVLAAPVAASMTKIVRPRPMGLAVSALLLLTSARELMTWAEFGDVRWAVYAGISALVIAAAKWGQSLRRSDEATDSTDMHADAA